MEPSQPTTDNSPAQKDVGVQPKDEERTPTMASPQPAEFSATAPSGATQTAWMILLVVALGLASGALGALLFSMWLREPIPQVKIGTISLARLTRAVADAEPESSAGFAPRFEAAVKRLVEAEPGLVLFVKEAVIDTGQIADYTDALMPLFGQRTIPTTPRADRPDAQLNAPSSSSALQPRD